MQLLKADSYAGGDDASKRLECLKKAMEAARNHPAAPQIEAKIQQTEKEIADKEKAKQEAKDKK